MQEAEPAPEAEAGGPSGFLGDIGEITEAARAGEPSPEEEAKTALDQVKADFREIMSGEPTKDVLITPLDQMSPEIQALVLNELQVDPQKDHPFGGDLLKDASLQVREGKGCRIFSVRNPTNNEHTGILVYTKQTKHGADRDTVAIVATDARQMKSRMFEGMDELLRSTAGGVAQAVAKTRSNDPDSRRHTIQF